MKRKLVVLLLVLFMILSTTVAFADVAVGDVVVSLGEDLSEDQKDAILNEFDPPEDALMITTTNEEEHQYLEGIVPVAQIGSNALSSVMVTYTESGSGINVETNHITYITEQAYSNSLITAGVEDADIKITAPFDVSGTAALTGIMKAYEASSGEEISDDVKKVANEEMVTTSDLAEDIGDQEASDLINEIKKQIAEQSPQSTEEVREIVINVTNNFNLELTDEQIEKLVSLFDRMRTLDIDWNQVGDQLENIANKAGEFLESEEGQGLLDSISNFFTRLFNWLRDLF
ncbi:MAG TPA: DUF1002 domain-containing protein [Eubacteriaceae bacterium]|nr:DUF1002 domain-containing protein [Eubacteriaceae bacterium]